MRLFTKKWIYNILLSAFTLLIMISCSGSSGGGGTPASSITPPPTFSLAKLFSATPLGEVVFIQIIGSSTDGASYTGSIKRTNRAEEMLGGILVTPSYSLINLVLVGSGLSQLLAETNYIDSSGNYISSKNSDGVICTPAFPDTPPLLVKVGDTGIMPTVTCINNTTSGNATGENTTTERSWIVADVGDGTILYTESGNDKNQSGIVTILFKNTYNINSSGDIVSFKSVTETVNGGNTVTLESI